MHAFLTTLFAIPLILLTNLPGRRSRQSIGLPQILISLFVSHWLVRTYVAGRYGVTVVIASMFLGVVFVESLRQAHRPGPSPMPMPKDEIEDQELRTHNEQNLDE
jgi:hypothetical protein